MDDYDFFALLTFSVPLLRTGGCHPVLFPSRYEKDDFSISCNIIGQGLDFNLQPSSFAKIDRDLFAFLPGELYLLS